ncbi:MAG: hypothetical protein R3B99_03500 [Polyangiales bacterium]
MNPGAAEACNGADEDCDTRVDEGAEATCSLPNATATCTAGSCAIDACADGWDDCTSGAGCESDVSSDPTSCGACGVSCEAHEVCRDSECVSVTDVVIGQTHACALISNGEVRCWGNNTVAELGVGTSTGSSTTPAIVQLYTTLPLNDAIAISTHPNARHTCALRADRTVWCWGTSGSGQCGPNAGAQANRAVPVELGDVASIAVGGSHSCAVLTSGEVRCWGADANGQLGDGTVTTGANATPVAMVDTAGPITDALQLGAGETMTCVLRRGTEAVGSGRGNRVSCAGREGSGGGWAGQLGRGSISSGNYPVADDVLLTALPAGTAFTSITTGSTHSCLMRVGARPACWGICTSGECSTSPLPRSENRPVPVVLALDGTTQIVAGRSNTCAVYEHPVFGPRVACFGDDGAGALGNGSAGSGATPNDVVTSSDGSTFLSGARLVAMGNLSTCAVLNNGRVACWGRNDSNVTGMSGPLLQYCDPTHGPDVP